MLAAVLTDGGFSYGEKMSECYVYIMQSGQRGGPIKIGVAKDPERRIRELQTGNPRTIVLRIKIKMPSRSAAYALEAWFHNKFWAARLEGEWFQSKLCNIKKAVDSYINNASISGVEVGERERLFAGKTREHVELLISNNKSLRARLIHAERKISKLDPTYVVSDDLMDEFWSVKHLRAEK